MHVRYSHYMFSFLIYYVVSLLLDFLILLIAHCFDIIFSHQTKPLQVYASFLLRVCNDFVAVVVDAILKAWLFGCLTFNSGPLICKFDSRMERRKRRRESKAQNKIHCKPYDFWSIWLLLLVCFSFLLLLSAQQAKCFQNECIINTIETRTIQVNSEPIQNCIERVCVYVCCIVHHVRRLNMLWEKGRGLSDASDLTVNDYTYSHTDLLLNVSVN